MTTPAKRAALKAADDQPFDFNLDAVKAEADLAPFRFPWGGKRWEFPHMESLDVWELMAEAGDDVGATIGVFRAALGDRFAEFRKIPLPQYKMKALFDAYARHCGIDPGESPGSTAS